MRPFEYPYANFHELNLDWILRQLQEFDWRISDIDQKIIDAVNEKFSDDEIKQLIADSLYSVYPPLSVYGKDEGDITESLQKACADENIKGVVVHAGNFFISNPIVINRSNFVILAHGAKIKALPLFNGRMFDIYPVNSDVDNVYIVGAEIDGNRESRTSQGYGNSASIMIRSSAAYYVHDIVIKDCKIYNSLGNAIHIDGYTVNYKPVRAAYNIGIINCDIANANGGGVVQSGINSIVENTKINNVHLECITVDNGCKNNVIRNCELSNNIGGSGIIGIDDSENCTIENNIIYNSTGTASPYGISVNNNTGSNKELRICGNTIKNCNAAGIRFKQRGTYDAFDKAEICNNMFENNTKDIIIPDINSRLELQNNIYDEGVEYEAINPFSALKNIVPDWPIVFTNRSEISNLATENMTISGNRIIISDTQVTFSARGTLNATSTGALNIINFNVRMAAYDDYLGGRAEANNLPITTQVLGDGTLNVFPSESPIGGQAGKVIRIMTKLYRRI